MRSREKSGWKENVSKNRNCFLFFSSFFKSFSPSDFEAKAFVKGKLWRKAITVGLWESFRMWLEHFWVEFWRRELWDFVALRFWCKMHVSRDASEMKLQEMEEGSEMLWKTVEVRNSWETALVWEMKLLWYQFRSSFKAIYWRERGKLSKQYQKSFAKLIGSVKCLVILERVSTSTNFPKSFSESINSLKYTSNFSEFVQSSSKPFHLTFKSLNLHSISDTFKFAESCSPFPISKRLEKSTSQ
jgi:hypothetical protein